MRLETLPIALQKIANPPKAIYYEGDLSLLDRPLVAIVGSRRPSAYTKTWTKRVASALRDCGAIVVSGGANGVDTAAHEAAFPNTIAILAGSIDEDKRDHIERIKQNALVLSEFEKETTPRSWSFVYRNRLVTGLSCAVCVMEANLQSGSSSSCNFALTQNKPLFVIPHRLGESGATNELLSQGKARTIWSEETLLSELKLSAPQKKSSDPVLLFAADRPPYEAALEKFGATLYEYELGGKIVVKDGRIELADARD
jgi:DNA processing protein